MPPEPAPGPAQALPPLQTGPGELQPLAVDWPAVPGVAALMSTRAGGTSAAPWGSLNLGEHVGDDPAAVQHNRRRWSQALGGAQPRWLRQVHGAAVVEATREGWRAGAGPQDPGPGDDPVADAVWTREPGVACSVLVADCLPVLLAATNGRAVAAAHAGWRGLAAGVVEAALARVCEAAGCSPPAVQAWLGPCIGPARFEVGEDVVQALGGGARFSPQGERLGRARWLADLPGLASDRLRRAGVPAVHGGRWCTVQDASRFFSFRRDGTTGRLAASVWLLA